MLKILVCSWGKMSLVFFFNHGTTFASLQSYGTAPEIIEDWNIFVKISSNWSVAALRINDDNESGSVALCVFLIFRSLLTPLLLISISAILVCGLLLLSVKLFRFSVVNTGWNYSFNAFALILFSLCMNPILFFDGATPIHS